MLVKDIFIDNHSDLSRQVNFLSVTKRLLTVTSEC